jgi:hypothetical protein
MIYKLFLFPNTTDCDRRRILSRSCVWFSDAVKTGGQCLRRIFGFGSLVIWKTTGIGTAFGRLNDCMNLNMNLNIRIRGYLGRYTKFAKLHVTCSTS